MWVRFPWLLIEYYTEEWLHKAGNTIGRIIKVDDTTLVTSQGKFARVCVEIGLDKSLVSSYGMRGEEGQLQYEGLHELCFKCGKYGQREIKCPLTTTNQTKLSEEKGKQATDQASSHDVNTEQQRSAFGAWLVVQKTHRWQPKSQKGNFVN